MVPVGYHDGLAARVDGPYRPSGEIQGFARAAGLDVTLVYKSATSRGIEPTLAVIQT